MMQVLDFLSDRARGFILTMTGAGGGLTLNALETTEKLSKSLEPLQRAVLFLTGMVAVLTIISYGYKFYKFCKKAHNERTKK